MPARILVVDDVPANVKLLEAKLGREYYEVSGVNSGAEALEFVAESPPDIVLLDIMMPGMDGFEVCLRLKQDPAAQHIPVLMVTALSDTEDRVRGLEVGADDFLTKPVNDSALFARVRSLTRLKVMMDEWRSRQHTGSDFADMAPSGLEAELDPTAARILVVEDSVIDREKIFTTLGQDYDDVSLAGSVREGLSLALANDYELVAVSLTMVAEDGLRLCSAMRSDPVTRQTPILLLSDEGDMGRVAKGLDLGANDYLLKPIDRNELLARVRTQVRRKRYQDRLRQNIDQGLSLALTDGLTGLFNRRYLMRHMDRTIARITENGNPLSVVMIDIDFFKSINDNWGHPVGDLVLKCVAETLQRTLRGMDVLARYGGEEFVVVMPETDAENAAQVAERLRTMVEEEGIEADGVPHALKVTISLGVTTSGDRDIRSEELLRAADEGLYAAKRAGRNQLKLNELPARKPHREHADAAS